MPNQAPTVQVPPKKVREAFRSISAFTAKGSERSEKHLREPSKKGNGNEADG